MINLGPAVQLLAVASRTKIHVTRSKRSFVNGVVTEGPQRSFDLLAVLAELNGLDLQRLPEGQRQTGTRVVFTTQPLKIGGQPDQESDRVSYVDPDGESAIYDVIHVERWPNGFYRTLLVKGEV